MSAIGSIRGRLVRSPALHFAALGAALFALHRWSGAADGARPAIVLAASDVARLRQAFAAEHGAPPSPPAEAALVEAAIDEEVLLREAVARGLDRSERVVRDRLAGLAEFLEEPRARDAVAGEEDARRLGLTSADVVIRRHLVETMRLLLAAPPGDPPTPAEIAAYVARHRDRFVEPERVRLTHVYLSRERRGAALEADAARLISALRREDAHPATAPGRGDPFVAGSDVAGMTPADLDRRFGPGFARAVAAVAPGTWAGPIASSYGLHLVWVHERTPAGLMPPPEMERLATLLLREEQSEVRLRDRLRQLRARYDVSVSR
jgi:hypothetical protein